MPTLDELLERERAHVGDESTEVEAALAAVRSRDLAESRRRPVVLGVAAAIVVVVVLAGTVLAVVRRDPAPSVDIGPAVTAPAPSEPTDPSAPDFRDPPGAPGAVRLHAGVAPEGFELRGGAIDNGLGMPTVSSEDIFNYRTSYIRWNAERTASFGLITIVVGPSDALERRDAGSPDPRPAPIPPAQHDPRQRPISVRGTSGWLLPDATLEWVEPGGPAVQVDGQWLGTDDLVAVADGLRFGPNATTDVGDLHLTHLPRDFVHLTDVKLGARVARISQLAYRRARDNASINLTIKHDTDERPEATLGYPEATVVAVRDRNGVRTATGDRPTLAWLEAPREQVGVTGAGVTDDELLAFANGLTTPPVEVWERYRHQPITASPQFDPSPPDAVEPFDLPSFTDPLGMVAADGTNAGQAWRLTLSETNPAIGRTERRLCTVFRGDHRGHQTCFPIEGRDPQRAILYAYEEVHDGVWFQVVVTQPGARLLFGPDEAEPPLPDRSEAAQHDLPVRIWVSGAFVPLPIRVVTADGWTQTIDVARDAPAPEGTRYVLAPAAVPGATLSD